MSRAVLGPAAGYECDRCEDGNNWGYDGYFEDELRAEYDDSCDEHEDTYMNGSYRDFGAKYLQSECRSATIVVNINAANFQTEFSGFNNYLAMQYLTTGAEWVGVILPGTIAAGAVIAAATGEAVVGRITTGAIAGARLVAGSISGPHAVERMRRCTNMRSFMWGHASYMATINSYPGDLAALQAVNQDAMDFEETFYNDELSLMPCDVCR